MRDCTLSLSLVQFQKIVFPAEICIPHLWIALPAGSSLRRFTQLIGFGRTPLLIKTEIRRVIQLGRAPCLLLPPVHNYTVIIDYVRRGAFPVINLMLKNKLRIPNIPLKARQDLWFC